MCVCVDVCVCMCVYMCMYVFACVYVYVVLRGMGGVHIDIDTIVFFM